MKENVDFNDKTEIFENASIPRAVAELAIPTVISQIITIVYNLADTFFVGQTNDPNQVAAVSICLPAFLGLTSLANLFGIGGASLMSRSFGIKDTETARKTSTFCIYAGIFFTMLYSTILYLFHKPLLYMFGASNLDFYYSYQYLFWVVIIGGFPTVLNSILSHLIRSEGYARHASIGLSLGGILNVILDPIFILPFGLNMGVKGAAIATMLSNIIASFYFLMYLFSKKNKSAISLHPKGFTFDRNIIFEVLLVGLPGCLMTLMASISNVVVNKLVSVHSESALAAIGIAKKINLTSMSIAQGLVQGILPLVGYSYSSGNRKRMLSTIRFTSICVLGFALICVTVFSLFSESIVSLFIENTETVRYGSSFLRIICLAIPTTALIVLITTVFQAVSKKPQALTLSIMRKGSLDIVFMIILNKIIPLYGITWATPVADSITGLIAIIFYICFIHNQRRNI